jgi:hypothetical protein
MPEISRFFGTAIAMHHDDREPPHFRARYHSIRAANSVRDMAVLEGPAAAARARQIR